MRFGLFHFMELTVCDTGWRGTSAFHLPTETEFPLQWTGSCFSNCSCEQHWDQAKKNPLNSSHSFLNLTGTGTKESS